MRQSGDLSRDESPLFFCDFSCFVSNINSGTYPSVDIAILSIGFLNVRLDGISMAGGDVSIPVQQQVDRQYENA